MKRIADQFRTHEVSNQPSPLADYNAFTSDIALMEANMRNGRLAN
jgi:hypothetical protein